MRRIVFVLIATAALAGESPYMAHASSEADKEAAPNGVTTAPLPAITMAHGYVGTKYHGIEPMAEAFAETGFVVGSS